MGLARARSRAQAQGPGPHFLLNIGPGVRASGRLSSKTAKSQNMVYLKHGLQFADLLRVMLDLLTEAAPFQISRTSTDMPHLAIELWMRGC